MSMNKEELQIPTNEHIETDEDALKVTSTEEIITKLTKINREEKQDNLKKILITQELFEQIKKSLTETVKNMEKNPSFFSRAADFWGELPLWQKILGGAVLTVPTLLIGIAAHIGFLLAICGVTTVIYAGGGIILDDHHKCSTSVIESLQKGILGLADLLELTINALEVIRKQLEAEILRFSNENEKLTQNINSLSEQIDAIEIQVMASSEVNKFLSETKNGLDKASNSLKEEVALQTDLLHQNQKKLNRINEAFGSSQKELAEKISEIAKVKTDLGEELTRAKMVIDALGATISEFSATIGNEEKQKAFQEKLDIFITDKESSFLQIAERICAAEQKLAIVQKELENTNVRYQELLEIQKGHIDRLEELRRRSPQETSSGEGLSQQGFYAIKKEMFPSNNEEQEFGRTNVL